MLKKLEKVELLQFLEARGDVTVSDVAWAFGVTIPTAASRLLRLYHQGYVKRQQIRRMYIYSLSEKGRARIEMEGTL